MRIGFVEAYYSESGDEPFVLLDIQLLDGTIAPELGNIAVAVSINFITDSGGPQNTFCCHGHTHVSYMFLAKQAMCMISEFFRHPLQWWSQ